MGHIHTEANQCDHTVTSYIMLLQPNEEPRVLMHVHRKLNVLLPAGGHVELDETPWQAVAHEIQEETGYTLNELQLLQPEVRLSVAPNITVHPQPVLMNTHEMRGTANKHYHSDTMYLFVAQSEPQGSVGEGESNDIRWLTRADVEAADLQEMYSDTKVIALAMFDTFLPAWQPVPATDFSLELPSAH